MSTEPDIDSSLQAWFFSLTPRERLEAVQSHANLVVTARGIERVLADRERDDRLSENPADSD